MVKVRKPTSEEVLTAYDPGEIEVHQCLRSDPVAFVQNVCGLTPHSKQVEFLNLPFGDGLHIMLPWGRQMGKSTIVAYLVAWLTFSVPGFRAYLFSPSGDQTKQIFDKICHLYETSEYLKRYLPSRIKGNVLHVGPKEWDSRIELVKIGLTGDLGRGRSSEGKGLVVFDEFSSFLYGEAVRGTLGPIIASGGSEIVLSSPGDPDSEMHIVYEHWKALEQQGHKRYRVIECEWSDTLHLKQEWFQDQKAEAETKGRLWEFEREVLGRWVKPDNCWFPETDLKRCQLETRPDWSKGDTFVWGADWGGRGRSAAVIAVARFSQSLSRLEVVDMRSFYFKNEKYHRDTEGSETIEDYNQLEEICCNLRLTYPPAWFGIDPATENSLTKRLANSYHMPVKEILVGGNATKERYLTALKNGIREGRLVWNDRRITQQLRGFAPRRKPDGTYEFPKSDSDIVVVMMNLYQYLGDREVTPFAFATAARQDGGKWGLW